MSYGKTTSLGFLERMRDASVSSRYDWYFQLGLLFTSFRVSGPFFPWRPPPRPLPTRRWRPSWRNSGPSRSCTPWRASKNEHRI